MNTKWKLLTLAAMLSATTTASAGDNGYGGQYDEDAYFADGSNYVASLYDDHEPAGNAGRSIAKNRDDSRNNVEPVAFVGDGPAYDTPETGAPEMGSGVATQQPMMDYGQPVYNPPMQSYERHQGSYNSMSCGDASCNGSCGNSMCRPRRQKRDSTTTWLTAEALLWFPQVRSTPPLVSTNDPGQLPELDLGANIAFGGNDAFGGDLMAGFRLDAGIMLNENFGVGGRFWLLPETDDEFNAGGVVGGQSIGIPFFDSDLTAASENSIKVSYIDPTNTDANFLGTVNARNRFEMYGAEGYGRLRLLEGTGYRSDFIGGFSHFGIEEGLNLNVRTTQTNNVGGAQGEVYTFNDNIEAENNFYGGQIGFLTSVGRGAWNLTALTKVHLGDMQQTLRYAGNRSRTNFADNDAGIFGASFEDVPADQLSQNNFTFAPEANLKLTFKMRPHVRFSVGYSFIMWDDVLLLGDNLNRNFATSGLIPGTQLGGPVGPINRPTFQGLQTDSFFVHGLDLGAVIEF